MLARAYEFRKKERVVHMKSIYEIPVTSANGKSVQLEAYKGKVLLIVNVASKCGFTPQYAGLEKLYNEYKEQGLRILAFPSNDFGEQEPGSMEEIKQFCATNYGVTFELFNKVHAKGDSQHPLYTLLTSQAEPQGEVQWNFEKFLISKEGNIIGRFSSKVTPEDAELASAIKKAL